MINKIEVFENCKKNLDRDRTIATGVGIFARIRKGNTFLTRRRTETNSLYETDLSGKWELPGGGVEIFDFAEEYQSAIISNLKRELMEEVGLGLISEKLNIILIPAWLGKGGLIDLAFVIDIPEYAIVITPEYEKLLEIKAIRWTSLQELKELEFISKRMKFLALKGIL